MDVGFSSATVGGVFHATNPPCTAGVQYCAVHFKPREFVTEKVAQCLSESFLEFRRVAVYIEVDQIRRMSKFSNGSGD
jgi:hypothetical protein